MIPAADSGAADRRPFLTAKAKNRTMADMRATVFYSGRVQGVGFRYTVKQLVCGYELCGAVRNLPDGRVQLVAEGTEKELKAFLAAVRDSGLGPMIRDEKIAWSEATNEFRGFEILS